jgi:hypothetical protein
VRPDIIALEIEPRDISVRTGTAVQLNLLATSARGGTSLIPGNMSVWSSSNDSVGEIDRQGRLKARSPGTFTITVRYAGNVAEASYTVVDQIPES